jgi:glyoxylase-like metal-dependent hydrolase (beta-lactamase superfamily II)
MQVRLAEEGEDKCMSYEFKMKTDNVYAIDTKMFGFDQYMSCYLVKGEELALVDTGHLSQLDIVRKAVNSYGFNMNEIKYIFLTHCEHGDHSGSAGEIIKEAPDAMVYFNQAGAWSLMEDTATERERIKELVGAQLLKRFGEKKPVPKDRMVFVDDGDVFDLGKGTKLRIINAPGHQPSGIALLEEKTMGLFIDDLVGNYFSDVDCSIILTPYNTNLEDTMRSLEKLSKIPANHLFLGHFGISDKPQYVIKRALDGMKKLMEIGAQCAAEGKLAEMEDRITASKMPEVEKLRDTRGEVVYQYVVEELLPHQATAFTKYYIKNYTNQKQDTK